MLRAVNKAVQMATQKQGDFDGILMATGMKWPESIVAHSKQEEASRWLGAEGAQPTETCTSA